MGGRRVAWGDRARAALDRVESLVEAGLPQRALAAANRALERETFSVDAEARLRLARSRALWLGGTCAAARVELEKARRAARDPETVAAIHNAAAVAAWRRTEMALAWSELDKARALEGAAGNVGLERAAIAGALLKDEGRLGDALAVVESGIAAASERERPAWQGRLLAERAGLLAGLGRWADALASVEAARTAFREGEDRREWMLAGPATAALELARGDLESARRALDAARAVTRGEPGDPRSEAELLLLCSDFHLAAGSPDEACQAAGGALALFVASGDRRGEGLAHARRAHACVAAGRFDEALVAARRAQRRAPVETPQLRAWAELALGRVMLRIDRGRAARHFAEALRLAGERRDLEQLARLGAALAAGHAGDTRELREALEPLLAWGDRRVAAFGVADVRDLAARTVVDQCHAPTVSTPCLDAVDPRSRALVDLALALASPGSWEMRWTSGLRALRPAVPWQHAVLAGEASVEMREDLPAPRPVNDDDPFVAIALTAAVPAVIDLRHDPIFREHPARILHRLDRAVIAPLTHGRALCLSFSDATGAAGAELIGEAARLFAAHLPEESAPEKDAAPTAFAGMLGRCPPMRDLFAQLARAAASEAFVYVSGETGTGKGRVALALHQASRRRHARLVAVNAASLSDELFEAELFGHARGAFTGAVVAREGYVAEAQGGTLFIDEVSELSPRAQAKLLRLLQEREYRRLGETEVRRADVRVVSAANVELEERVAKGLFREDLLYRLAVVTLRVPPLRDRGDDVLQLARHFLREACARDGRPAPVLPRAIAQVLLRYAWPGNVRELENEMSRLVAMSGMDGLELLALSGRVRTGAQRPGSGATRLREALIGFERSFVSAALERNGRNRTRTAVEIGISRQALLGKLSRLGVA